jgi:hypothetical protein
VWIPFTEALDRAGSFEALRPYLRDGRIPARHNGMYFWPEGGALFPPGEIDPGSWRKANFEPEIEQVRFITIKVPLYGGPERTRHLVAIDLELGRSAVDALFPVANISAPRNAGGRDFDHDWENAAHHVDDWVAAHEPLPRNKNGKPILARAVELMTEWFAKNDPPAPQERSIRRWIGKKPRSWWGPN